MTGAALELALRRDRLIVVAALLLLTAVAASYIIGLAVNMNMSGSVPASEAMAGMDMGGAPPMSAALLPGFRAWGFNEFAFIFTMWAVMMVGMMTPSVAPMVLLYAMVGRKAVAAGKPFAATSWFFAGYIAIWIAFSVIATASQWVLTLLALLSPMMTTGNMVLGGVILIAAGAYQWTPMKTVCLKACQGPLAFISSHGGFRSDPFGALRLGAEHGLYCLGCCWALMALLFVGGVMNLLWIAGIGGLILLEKVLPAGGTLVARIAGVFICLAGAWLLIGTLWAA